MLPALLLPERESSPFALRREIPRSEVPPPVEAIAFVDIETTGLDRSRHEILEIGIVRVEARSLEVLAEYEALVVPEHLEDAQPEALAICGFSKAGWAKARPLRDALLASAPLLEGAVIAGHNVGFDWAFLEAGYRRAGLVLPFVDYHRLDTASLAWPLFASGELRSLSLDAVTSSFGIERPLPHRALVDARCALEVARRLTKRTRLGGLLESLAGDELEIAVTLLQRLVQGRKEYGPWHVDDGRDYPRETFEEVLDGLHYAAAEIVRHRRRERDRVRRIYVCHPFADDPDGNIARVREISQQLVALGVMPVAPHLYFPQLLDEATQREQALSLCLELVSTCDEVRVFGGRITAGMKREIEYAKARGIPVRFEREVLA